MLEIRDLHVRYGAITAVRGVDLDIRAGEIVALIGANGAGKSTIARAVAGLLPFQGEVRYQGRALKPNNAEQNLRSGIALVPEGRGILARMTVEENLLMGLYCRRDRAAAMTELGKLQERFPILAERRDRIRSGRRSYRRPCGVRNLPRWPDGQRREPRRAATATVSSMD